MKADIQNREDIRLLMDVFYKGIKADKRMSYFFCDLVKIEWSKHLDLMTDFWSNVLFFDGLYMGNPMKVHQDLHNKSALTILDFQTWQDLFVSSVDSLFEGEYAERIKQRAQNISQVMQSKILDT